METSVKYIRLFKGEDEQFYFTFIGGNGEVLATSEGYTRRSEALETASEILPGVEINMTDSY